MFHALSVSTACRYLRDTRRAIGLDGFRLMHTQLRDTIGGTGKAFFDSVALGDYNDDMHHLKNGSGAQYRLSCTYPEYLGGASSLGEGEKP